MRHAVVSVAAVAMLLGLAGCGRGGYPVPRDVQELASRGVRLHVAWSVDVATEEYFGSDAYQRGGVAVDGAREFLVATTASGEVLGINARSGEVMWTQPVSTEAFSAAPALAAGIAYVAVPDGSVRALRMASGGEVWSADLGDVYHSAPTVTADRVYVNSATGVLYAIDRATGNVVWTVERPGHQGLSVTGGGGVRALDGVVYAGFPDGTVAAIDAADGALYWLADLAGDETRLRDVDTTPLVAADGVYAASFAGGLYRLDRITGDVVWRNEVRGATSPLAVGETLVTSTADGRVVWVSPETGDVVSELSFDGDAAGELVRWDDRLLMGEPHDGMYVLDAARPWIFARFNPASGFLDSGAAAGAWFWGLSNGGTIYGVELVPAGQGT